MRAELKEQPGFPVPQFMIIAETSTERDILQAFLEYPVESGASVEVRWPLKDEGGPYAFHVGYRSQPNRLKALASKLKAILLALI